MNPVRKTYATVRFGTERAQLISHQRNDDEDIVNARIAHVDQATQEPKPHGEESHPVERYQRRWQTPSPGLRIDMVCLPCVRDVLWWVQSSGHFQLCADELAWDKVSRADNIGLDGDVSCI